MPQENKIFCGDNLAWLNSLEDNSIDLCYIDPPFFTQRTLATKKAAFSDKFQTMNYYISWMKQRIALIHAKLKTTGSIYLHCDWHASHRLRCLLDDVFGADNFRNEIIWYYSGGASQKRTFARKHDNLFFYAKDTKRNVFHADQIRVPYEGNGGYQNSNGIVNNGKRYRPNPLGKIPTDVWKIPIIHPNDKFERSGYPTQKPEALLKRILLASTRENGIVLDCFCGSGTTAKVAADLNRRFIVGDASLDAIRITTERLKKFHPELKFEVVVQDKVAA